jgi:hypothetical protein
MKKNRNEVLSAILVLLISISLSGQTIYNVGPEQALAKITDVPWESLKAGDVVNIYYKPAPYKEKFGITTRGNAQAPIIIHGVLGPNGERPVLDGDGAITRSNASGYNQVRGIVTIGGYAGSRADYVILENLELINAHTPYSYTNNTGALVNYQTQSAGIFIEASDHITIRNTVIHACGNGLFVASDDSEGDYRSISEEILVEKNYFYGNGNSATENLGMTEHDSYCEAKNIIYQFNHYGPLIDGSRGYCLKDRSTNTIIRYNWIEGGRHEISMDEPANLVVQSDSNFHIAHVYGNILVKTDIPIRGWGDDEMVSFGGDGDGPILKKGPLYFYNNTLISRMNIKEKGIPSMPGGRLDRGTVLSLTDDVIVDVRNNIIHKTGTAKLDFLNGNDVSGHQNVVTMYNNWLTEGWNKSEEGVESQLTDYNTITGLNPGLVNIESQDYHIASGSPLIHAGTNLHSKITATDFLTQEYVVHQLNKERHSDGLPDIGAFGYEGSNSSRIISGPDESSQQPFNFSPNPVNDLLTVNLADPQNHKLELKLMDSFGKLLEKVIFEAGEKTKTVQTDKLASGIYFMQLRDLESMKSAKLIVLH